MQTSQPAAIWTMDATAAMETFQSNESGLSNEQANIRRKQYGYNSVSGKNRSSNLLLLLGQLKAPVTLLLLGAAVLSALLGDRTDTYIIFTIVAISSLLGFWQEKGAADAVEQLSKLVQVSCRALRDGHTNDIAAADIVPGDIILLSAGAMIPADCLLLSSSTLFADEATFTGESFPVEKTAGKLPAGTPLNKRTNCLYMGCHIVSGTGKALVTATGAATEFGHISDALRSRIPETEFEKGITRFGYLLMRITFLLVFIIFALNVYLHKPVLDSFLFSLALAVGLTPQLLPVIVSVNLASGARRMAAKKVIVKRLSCIPNFGSMTVLCSDKTGTLTEGTATLKDTVDVSGLHSEKVKRLAWLNASLQQGFRNPIDTALCALNQEHESSSTLLAEIPYDFIRKRLSVQTNSEGSCLLITKGAFDSVLAVCTQVEQSDGRLAAIGECEQQIKKMYEQQTALGYRVLGIAWKNVEPAPIIAADEKEMVFAGFITLFDPPKKGVKETIAQLKALGVSLKVITGDSEAAALTLMKTTGIANPVLLTGNDIRNMNSAALAHQAARTDVFAAIEPNQKEQIILALKKSGEVTGFMGDGINDAPALHAADIGISVNTAVEVARDAADIILLESDLGVLGSGVKEGRYTFANTMKYIFMATSANFGNMFSMAGASVFLSFLPLLPKQILLTNLLTDLPEMTIAGDRVDPDIINRPQHWDLRFIKKFMVVFGLLSSLFDYCTFALLLFALKANQAQFQTGWFTESVISAALIVLVMRTRFSFFKSRPSLPLQLTTLLTCIVVLCLPWLPFAGLLGFEPLPLRIYGWLLLIVFGYIIAAEITKKIFYHLAMPVGQSEKRLFSK
ncbi:MAG: magnesium-translocating P-type ATPase [Bacteroidota bacterium]|nr:magnesium-translocating P-type ATPase [Bacteroidota bacterium]